MQNNTGREAEVALRLAEETRLQVVSLKAPVDRPLQAIVESAAPRGAERSVGTKAIDVDMRNADQRVRKRPKASHGHRHARTEKKIMFARISVDEARAARDRTRGRHASASVETAEIGNEADEGEDLSFERSIPSVEIGSVIDSKGRAIVGVTNENVSTRWDLREKIRRQDECKDTAGYERAHGAVLLIYFSLDAIGVSGLSGM